MAGPIPKNPQLIEGENKKKKKREERKERPSFPGRAWEI
jgi:hypothetical protein